MKKRVILITGVSSGFGQATAFALLDRGCLVYGLSRSLPDEALGKRLTGHFRADLCDEKAVKTAIRALIRQAGRVDVVINNAGIGIGGSLEETDDETMHRIFEVNFHGMCRVCRAVLPYMRKQGGGRILNVSSLGGRIGLPFQGAYSATKYAVEGYTEALYHEVKPFHIRVSLIEPGDFKTGFTAHRTHLSQKGSPYEAAGKRALSRIEKDEQNGSEPELFAETILRILSSKNPALRYRCGSLFQKLLTGLRPLMGERMFLFLLGKYYA
ncbi:MAG: SDR family oxidoreductase [Lachnospiraceae bacterium]|nr:SDR family oxidoreductase [Lachnospiraceae bacterium]